MGVFLFCTCVTIYYHIIVIVESFSLSPCPKLNQVFKDLINNISTKVYLDLLFIDAFHTKSKYWGHSFQNKSSKIYKTKSYGKLSCCTH